MRHKPMCKNVHNGKFITAHGFGTHAHRYTPTAVLAKIYYSHHFLRRIRRLASTPLALIL